jgi:hypothetical protein
LTDLGDSLEGYAPQRKAYDSVLEVKEDGRPEYPHGIVLRFDNPKSATSFRTRCYEFRKADRRRNQGIYPPDHSKYGRSDYDPIIISLDKGVLTMYIPEEPVIEAATP